MTEDPPPLHWVEIERRMLMECTHEVVGLHPRRRDGIADAIVHQRRGKDHRVVLVAARRFQDPIPLLLQDRILERSISTEAPGGRML